MASSGNASFIEEVHSVQRYPSCRWTLLEHHDLESCGKMVRTCRLGDAVVTARKKRSTRQHPHSPSKELLQPNENAQKLCLRSSITKEMMSNSTGKSVK
jgi:hypothetical protein